MREHSPSATHSSRPGGWKERARGAAAALASAALGIGALVLPVAQAPAAQAAELQCPVDPRWGGIGNITGRDANVSTYAGGDLRVTGRVSELEGLTVVGGDLDLTDPQRAVLFGMVGMGSGLWPYPDADMLAVGGDTRTNPAGDVPFVTGNGRVGGVAEGPALRVGFAEISDAQVTYGLGDDALLAGEAPTGTTSITEAAPYETTVTAYVGDLNTLRVENELLVTFTGDGSSALQVFELDGAALTALAGGKSGVSFEYAGIPAGASVVVNVTGSEIAFPQGWRTIFNGVDVHDPFVTPDEFAAAATAVLFSGCRLEGRRHRSRRDADRSRRQERGAAAVRRTGRR